MTYGQRILPHAQASVGSVPRHRTTGGKRDANLVERTLKFPVLVFPMVSAVSHLFPVGTGIPFREMKYRERATLLPSLEVYMEHKTLLLGLSISSNAIFQSTLYEQVHKQET